MKRRTLMATAGAWLAAGCAHRSPAEGGSAGNAAGGGDEAGDRVIDSASGRPVGRAELIERLRHSDFVLLGEQHDNPHHHQRRGQLITQLGPRCGVVAEHLPRGAQVVAEHLPRGAQVGPGTDLLARLQAAGFNAKGWHWPLHEALFAPVLAAGLPLWGGNAPLDTARAVARQGDSALPRDLATLLAAAPLPPAAQAALDQALVDGHCGQLPAARVPAMRAAQRLRDAAMAAALLAAADAGARPAVLVAGNGHVRNDHGVPSLLRAQRPGARIVSVAFVDAADAAVPADLVWTTPVPPTARQDPCAGFTMPARR